MAVNTLEFQQPTQSDTNRAPSMSIWADCPVQSLQDQSINGSYFFDDFVSFEKTPATTEGNWAAGGGYAQFSDTGGTIANDTTALGGAVAIGSDGDNEGCSFRTRSVPFQIIRTGKKFWFEARILTSTIADAKHNIFIGLMEDAALTATVPLSATGTLADQNLVGFQRPETVRSVAGTGGAILNTVYKANGVTAVTVQSDAVTLVASTYVKLGMVFEPAVNPFNKLPASTTSDAVASDGYGRYLLSFYADGVLLATQKQIPTAAGTDFPNDVPLGLVFAVLNATASSPGTSSIDWWRCAQLY
jgi:hypothetical protein